MHSILAKLDRFIADRPLLGRISAAWAFAGRAVIVGVVASMVGSVVSAYLAARPVSAPTTEVQLAATLKKLEQNSQEATQLLNRIQGEALDRTKKLEELRQLHTLLELTPTQRKAIDALRHTDSTAAEIFTSRDFWLGRFLLSAGFFLAGIAVMVWRSKKANQAAVATAAEDRERLARIEAGMATLIADKRVTAEEAHGFGYRPESRESEAFRAYYVAPVVNRPMIVPPEQNVRSADDDRKK